MTHLDHIVWLAQQAYETYRDSPGSRWCEDAPPWKGLPTDERDAWQRVAERLWGRLIGD